VTSPTDDDRAADETLPAGGHTTVAASGEAANPTRGEPAIQTGDEPAIQTGEAPTIQAEPCPRCGATLADHVCPHGTRDEDFGDPALVRRFVSFPDLYRGGRPPQPLAGPHPVGRSAAPDDVRAGTADPTDDVRTVTADPTDEKEPAAPAAFRERFDAVPKAVTPIGARHQAVPAGSRLSAVMVPVVVASGSILLATVAGIGGAVITGSAGNGAATPSAAAAPAERSSLPYLSPKPGAGPSRLGPSVTSLSGAGSSGVNPPTTGHANVTPATTPASRQLTTPQPPTGFWGPGGPGGWGGWGGWGGRGW
jgi:hypothetical protein